MRYLLAILNAQVTTYLISDDAVKIVMNGLITIVTIIVYDKYKRNKIDKNANK